MIKFCDLNNKEKYAELDAFFKNYNLKNVMLVCGKSYEKYWIKEYFSTLEKRMHVKCVLFQEFQPNPEMKSVVSGKELFLLNQCDGIVAVGGGSAIDVAKGIKFYSMKSKENIPFLAIPTTAGTGSEETHFAVIYENGEKLSIAHKCMLPDEVILDESLLANLPLYHKKAALMDAYCHAIESFWSIYSTKESEKYATEAIILIQDNYKRYLEEESCNDINYKILLAANYAGKAINISKTTAGHAMSYKLTSLYGIAHGHAVALCVEKLWYHLSSCIESGKEDIDYRLRIKREKLCKVMQCDSLKKAAELFTEMVNYMQISSIFVKNNDIELLKKSVNAERLKNYPIELMDDEIKEIYESICWKSN